MHMDSRFGGQCIARSFHELVGQTVQRSGLTREVILEQIRPPGSVASST